MANVIELADARERGGAAQGGGLLAEYPPLIPLVGENGAAALLDMNVNTLRILCREGRLPNVKIGRRVYVLRDELERVLMEGLRDGGEE